MGIVSWRRNNTYDILIWPWTKQDMLCFLGACYCILKLMKILIQKFFWCLDFNPLLFSVLPQATPPNRSAHTQSTSSIWKRTPAFASTSSVLRTSYQGRSSPILPSMWVKRARTLSCTPQMSWLMVSWVIRGNRTLPGGRVMASSSRTLSWVSATWKKVIDLCKPLVTQSFKLFKARICNSNKM